MRREFLGLAVVALTTLPFPVGIADLKKIAGIDFDEGAYKQVSQYIYMGNLDRNDTTLSRDAFRAEHAELIRALIGAEMPKRWHVSQSIYRELGLSAQCVAYNGSGHVPVRRRCGPGEPIASGATLGFSPRPIVPLQLVRGMN